MSVSWAHFFSKEDGFSFCRRQQISRENLASPPTRVLFLQLFVLSALKIQTNRAIEVWVTVIFR
jgi:hypothetical protein